MSIVRAKKHLGQHFLKDQNIACKITASLLPVTKGVLEIGPGMGVLTRHLLKDTKFSVLAIDIDQESIDYLHEELPAHKEQIIYGDFLKSIFEISTQNRFRSSGIFLITSLRKSFSVY